MSSRYSAALRHNDLREVVLILGFFDKFPMRWLVLVPGTQRHLIELTKFSTVIRTTYHVVSSRKKPGRLSVSNIRKKIITYCWFLF